LKRPESNLTQSADFISQESIPIEKPIDIIKNFYNGQQITNKSSKSMAAAFAQN
jgi:hypothetical protein